MTKAMSANKVVDEYLKELEAYLRHLPESVRREYLSSIKEHIAEGRSLLKDEDDSEIRAMLKQIGEPKVLAAELFEESDYARKTSLGNLSLRLGIAALVAVLLVGGIISRATYQPPISGLISYVRVTNSRGEVLEATQPGGKDDPTAPSVWLEPRGVFTVEVIAVLKNSGRYGATLDSIQPPLEGAEKLRFIVFFSGGGNHYWGSLGAFHPVSMPGGQTVSIGIRYAERCIPGPGTYIRYQSLPVNYSFLGVHHFVMVNIQPFILKQRELC